MLYTTHIQQPSQHINMFGLEPCSPDFGPADDFQEQMMEDMGSYQNPQAIAFPSTTNRKRKMADDDEGHFDLQAGFTERRKLNMPRCMPGSANQMAQFHPLPEDVNRKMLADLNMLPGQLNASSLFQHLQQSAPLSFPGESHSPSSPASELHPGTPRDGFFGRSSYPDFDSCARSISDDASLRSRHDSGVSVSTRATSFGIYEPMAGATNADSMCVDNGKPQGHGPHCTSLAQLSVRSMEGGASELWATCQDCGASTKVVSDTPANPDMGYSP